MKKKMCYVESTEYMLVRNSKKCGIFLFSLIFWLNIYSQISNSLIESIKLSVTHYISYTDTKKAHTSCFPYHLSHVQITSFFYLLSFFNLFYNFS